MKKLYFLFSITLLLLVGCSSTVNGVDKDFYKQSKEYAIDLANILNDKDYMTKHREEIYTFLNKDITDKNEKDIIKNLTILFNLHALGLTEIGLEGKLTNETKNQIEKTVKYLNTEYDMNID